MAGLAPDYSFLLCLRARRDYAFLDLVPRGPSYTSLSSLVILLPLKFCHSVMI